MFELDNALFEYYVVAGMFYARNSFFAKDTFHIGHKIAVL